jgi:hypothetical protein
MTITYTYKVKKSIEIKFTLPGIHCYPAAATDPTLATGDWGDVSFLAHPHMHHFYFIVEIDVTHSDRDIEFIQFQRWCQRLYSTGTLQLDHQSCEMVAESLVNKIHDKYPGRRVRVSVYEDNINGAHVEYLPVESGK